MFNLILFGPPGSGKGTQACKIAEKYGFGHISTGEIFRREMKNETELGLKVKGIVERGELVPDEVLVEILEAGIRAKGVVEGMIFDGYPRTLQQADDLGILMQKKNDTIDIVLSLEVNDKEIIDRLLKRAQKEGRKDDTREVIENRIEVYNKQTQPLIDYYKERGVFASVNGIGTIDEIFDGICKVIDKKLSTASV
jgi:adenylate kinase